ncbi:hypothetical protein ANN_13813 [Periplaneta americana]|uniref:Uncharacterized protein n=1 Tax=Periplaneta americana TaxID=6978 RepID=A0ABQ8SUK1_PERAM|nr:hypothetical protein ANN_13813 [Periplaneta americana]
MAGLFEGGNEPPGSLKASDWLFNDAVSTTRLLIVDEIGDEMVFGEMRPRIRHRLPGIRLKVGETSENTQPGNGIAATLTTSNGLHFDSSVFAEAGHVDLISREHTNMRRCRHRKWSAVYGEERA